MNDSNPSLLQIRYNRDKLTMRNAARSIWANFAVSQNPRFPPKAHAGCFRESFGFRVGCFLKPKATRKECEVFVAASSRCFAEKPFFEACQLVTDLEYDKIEIWMSSEGAHLHPGETAAAPDKFIGQYRESTRLTPIAITLEEDVEPKTLAGLSKLAKLMRIAQLTVPASPLGTPFNTEIDRLREFVQITGGDGVRLSIKTKTGHLSEDPRTAVELCQAVPGLGLTLDPSYYICGPCRGQSFDPVYPFVHHVQLRDTSPDRVQVQTGLGEVDYARLIAHLEKQHYKLALSVDLIPEFTDQNDRPLEMRKLKMLLDTLL